VYEWRTFLAAGAAPDDFAEAQRQGYEHAASCGGVHHFRRKRADDARPGDR
jgi:hypothetical protein